MAAQLNYGFSTPKGVAGGKVDLADDIVASRTVEAEDGVLKFGMAVAVGENAGDGIKLVSEGTTKEQIDGVLLHAANTEQDMSGKVVIKKGTTQSVMRKGHVWGRLASNAEPTYNKPAYVVATGEDAGCFTHEADSNIDIGAVFGNASDTGIAVIVL